MTKIFVALLAVSSLCFGLDSVQAKAVGVAKPAPAASKSRKVASDGAAPAPTETAKAVADGGLDSVLASKVTPIEGADHRCGNEKGGFAFNTQSKRIWQTGDSQDMGLELTVKSLSVGDRVEASASLESLVQYSFNGSWSELSVKLSGDGEEETFKLPCR